MMSIATASGTRSEAKRRVSEGDLKWADVVFVMEREHKSWIATQFKDMTLSRIEVLDIPDGYQYMDTELQRQLRLAIDPEIEAILTSRK